MTDTETATTFDPDAVFQQAQARLDQIKSSIEFERNKKHEADVRIRSLNEELAKTQRIVSAMTPRTRTVKPLTSAAPKAAKAAAASKSKGSIKGSRVVPVSELAS